MPSTIDIRRRIRSVKNTQQITKAMKMVAAAKLRRAQERMFAARPYAAGLRKVLASVATRVDINAHPLLAAARAGAATSSSSSSPPTAASAARSTRTSSARRRTSSASTVGESVELLPIGRKASDFFKRRTIPIRQQRLRLPGAVARSRARDRRRHDQRLHRRRRSTRVYVVYNEFKSIIAQIVRVERLLPIERGARRDARRSRPIDYLYEPGPEQILSELLPKHIEFQLYRMLLESAAAEQGARMTAMEAATKNASDMIDHLTLTYNRIRQAAITKEIIEIVSAARH